MYQSMDVCINKVPIDKWTFNNLKTQREVLERKILELLEQFDGQVSSESRSLNIQHIPSRNNNYTNPNSNNNYNRTDNNELNNSISFNDNNNTRMFNFNDKNTTVINTNYNSNTSFSDSTAYKPNMIHTWDDNPSNVIERANCVMTTNPSWNNNNANNNSFDYGFNNNASMYGDETPLCLCSEPAIRLVSRQQQSMDQPFYSCAKPRSAPGRCDFFKWEDENFKANQSMSFVNGGTGGERVVKDIDVELQRMFGHKTGFRQGQRECIQAAIQGRDVFCLMPTGGGKSLVYQVC